MMINSRTLVRVKPQSYGIEQYNLYLNADKTARVFWTNGNYELKPIDENGFVVLPLAIMMQLFGNMMGVHRERPIDETCIEILTENKNGISRST